jgi:Diphthamide synthase subunit DPH2
MRDVDSEWFEAFVVTSCPRLPVDDLYEYEKPVLTPGEAFMALQGRLEPYMFPW